MKDEGGLRALTETSWLGGANAPFIEELYDRFLEDPASVPPEWSARFREIAPADVRDVAHEPIRRSLAARARTRVAAVPERPGYDRQQVSVLQLINQHRFQGMRLAALDPLKRMERPEIPELDPVYYGFTEADMDTVFETGSLVGPARASLREILWILRQTYCGSIGTEYMYITDTAQKRWIQERIESNLATPRYESETRRKILELVTAAETLERYLHTRYTGQKRFSLEGAESLIPILDFLVRDACLADVQEMVIGMAHRGRLNVLVNTLGKLPQELFREFEGKYTNHLISGDVKYHQGFSSDIAYDNKVMHVTLAFNPSHLEIVEPVVQGSVRARQHRRHDKEGTQVIPVVIHGDAAFAGQGVVMESLAMSKTRGFYTGGTIHIVVNNQIGFTTSDPRDTRSSLYCTDIAKMVEAPVFHVNGDDPEAVVFATKLAFEYRTTWHRDVVIDLVCFRRLGHNEQDEPLVTQPLMYKKIAKHPGTRKLYADRLIADGVIAPDDPQKMIEDYRTRLDAGTLHIRPPISNFKLAYATDWSPFKGTDWRTPAPTGVPIEDLKRLAARVTTVPDGFVLHPRVEKIIADRRLMGEGKLPIDWGMAETLAYASLLEAGYAVRISGQDTARGTFFHRHAVLHDQKRERWDAGTYVPLQNLSASQAKFVAIDSLLSEEAVLAFEYGYATAEPNELVIWEAQFGDFANGAQVVIDQFIAAGEAKWGRLCGLVMFLPHGQEGQGPEHSSARLERYLQLCAEHNIQVCQPSTAAGMFHMLRRQMLRPYRKPLIVMTPKSLLRNVESFSSLEDLASGSFRPIAPDPEKPDAAKVTRVLLCSGKVYHDLAHARRERGALDTAIVRVPQLYPFPDEELKAEMARWPNTRDVVWVQEEPMNQGAWYNSRHHFHACLAPGQTLRYAGRPPSPAPAPGYYTLHVEQTRALIEQAFGQT
jgi:2-oxoglutarate dehydrogenase E1 component